MISLLNLTLQNDRHFDSETIILDSSLKVENNRLYIYIYRIYSHFVFIFLSLIIF